MSERLSYRDAGVDIDAADDAKARIGRIVESTFTSGARGKFGGFGGLFRMPAEAKRPLLVSSADGVGTKIKIAIESGRHDTIGHDLVNHCVNDILVQGAEPLFFMDYVAFGVLEPAVVEAVVSGVAAGCRENGCSLLGGETAEMPGLYTPPDYDLAGFIVGYVEEDRLLGSERVKPGQTLIGFASTGLHTNGYSLARRILDRAGLKASDDFPGGGGTVADVMLATHRSYLPALKPMLAKISAMAHITGGGITGNLDRALPKSVDAVVETASWTIPNVFVMLEQAGSVDRGEMFRAFNMGVGMIAIADEEGVDAIVASARSAGVEAWELGRTVPGSGRVILN